MNDESQDKGGDGQDATVMLAAEAMHASIRDVVIGEIKAAGTPWQIMPQQTQDELIERVDKQVSWIIGRAVNTLVSHQFPIISGTLESVTVKDEIKAILKFQRFDSGAHDIMDSVGSKVRLVVVDLDQFEQEQGSESSDLDQPDLPLDDAEE